MIIQETVVYKLLGSDLERLLGVRRKDTIKSVDVKNGPDGCPVLVSITVSRPARGKWFSRVVTK